MARFELLRYGSADELADAAAHEWLRDLAQFNEQDARYSVALSGGRIAGRFLAATAALALARGQRFESAEFFWGDERCVPPDDPESNFALARARFLAPLNIPEAHTHRVRGEEAPELAAAHAEAELRRVLGVPAGQPPALALVFLGLGEEGHVASLFPGESEAEIKNPAVFRPVVAAKPPPHRITLGYKALAAARQVWVLASGAGKESALHESLSGDGRTPLARVVSMRSATRIFTDLPA